mmetsp:Transcript_36496/g.97165  ORF Transcript_36496/g.97165 Transcript_36496/m.97165 type:complete len:284 (-) Transcript_36496:434-1285(-)
MVPESLPAALRFLRATAVQLSLAARHNTAPGQLHDCVHDEVAPGSVPKAAYPVAEVYVPTAVRHRPPAVDPQNSPGRHQDHPHTAPTAARPHGALPACAEVTKSTVVLSVDLRSGPLYFPRTHHESHLHGIRPKPPETAGCSSSKRAIPVRCHFYQSGNLSSSTVARLPCGEETFCCELEVPPHRTVFPGALSEQASLSCEVFQPAFGSAPPAHGFVLRGPPYPSSACASRPQPPTTGGTCRSAASRFALSNAVQPSSRVPSQPALRESAAKAPPSSLSAGRA